MVPSQAASDRQPAEPAVAPIDGTGVDDIAGDANSDGEADFADFLILTDNFGREEAEQSDGDFNSNGKVDFADFLILSEKFGEK